MILGIFPKFQEWEIFPYRDFECCRQHLLPLSPEIRASDILVHFVIMYDKIHILAS